MQPDPELLRACWFLAGPTACGKSAAACELAERLDAEILSLDSMTVYRDMDIGTAKPDTRMRLRVPHHMIDIVDPGQEFSLAEYVATAEQVARDIIRRGHVPLFVGGTGLYLRALLRGISPGPAANEQLRRDLTEQAERKGPETVHELLRQCDPVLAARLHPGDLRRVIRGIEVYRATGQPLSGMQQHGPLPEGIRPRHVFWLHPPRDWLHERINLRVTEMFQQGLVAEVQRLLARTPPLGSTARQALGYLQVIEGLAAGSTENEMIADIQIRTRQFAKRQHTWFRHLEECRMLEMRGTETAAELAGLVRQAAQSR